MSQTAPYGGAILDSFETMVREYAETESTRIIENASMAHALIIVRQLIQTATQHGEEIRIVSGRLMRDFYSQLVSVTRAALEKVTVSVVVLSKEELDGNKFYDLVTNSDRGEVVVLDSPPSSMSHFVVVGDRRYRVELDDGQKKALASFNDDVIPQMLKAAHHNLLEIAKK